jgi:hypothetical protein
LLEALDGVERLMLLDDVVELPENRNRRRDGRSRANPPPDRRDPRRPARGVFVPGNHDRALVAARIRRVGVGLAGDSPVPADATGELARVASWLAPARVRVHDPGVWPARRACATHGHYLDRHLLPSPHTARCVWANRDDAFVVQGTVRDVDEFAIAFVGKGVTLAPRTWHHQSARHLGGGRATKGIVRVDERPRVNAARAEVAFAR